MQAQQRFAQRVLPVAVAIAVAIAVALPAFAAQRAMAADASGAASIAPAASPPATAAVAPAATGAAAPAVVAVAPASPAAGTGEQTAQDAKDSKDTTFGVAMSSDQLDEHRGGDALIGTNNLTGSVEGNLASHVATGSNVVDGGSFANSSGLPTVIQNTGANVLIQNATVLNVRFGD